LGNKLRERGEGTFGGFKARGFKKEKGKGGAERKNSFGDSGGGGKKRKK